MKRGCLISLGALALVVLVSVASLIYVVAKANAPTVEKGSFVEIRVGGSIPENVTEASLFGADPLTMRDLSDVLHWAGDDARVQGIVLRIEPLGVGWAKLEELRDEIEAVKAKGKTVVAFMEEGGDPEYYLATAADKIFMPPMGFLGIDGISTERQFYKGTFDKVGVEYDGVHIGKFKSAPETYSRTSMSDPAREEYTTLIDGLFTDYVSAVSTARKMPVEKVRELVDGGPYQATVAKDKGLVDDTFYWDEFESWVKGTSSKKPQILSAEKVRSMAESKRTPGALDSSEIAIIYATGEIMPGESSGGGFTSGATMGSETMVEALKQAREDDSIKAVVLRIDSPGGSVIASDVIWRAVQITKAKKPVVVSMSDLAASGGYYIAMGASAIVAQPGTLTGSIGIFTGKFVTKDLYTKVGVTTEAIKRGANADMYSSSRKFTEAERVKIEKDLRDSYDVFISKVAEGRGMDKQKVDDIAQGRVWIGEKGKEIGLVDELGGLDRAIEVAKTKAGLHGEQGLVILPRKRSLFDKLRDTKGLVQAGMTAAAPPLPAPVSEAMEDASAWSRLPDGTPMMLLPFRIRIR
jgi:protease-4